MDTTFKPALESARRVVCFGVFAESDSGMFEGGRNNCYWYSLVIPLYLYYSTSPKPYSNYEGPHIPLHSPYSYTIAPPPKPYSNYEGPHIEDLLKKVPRVDGGWARSFRLVDINLWCGSSSSPKP